jgi:hypothetical protein
MMPYLTAIFFILYAVTILKRPFYAHIRQSIKRGLISVVAFACLTHTLNFIMKDPQGSVLT